MRRGAISTLSILVLLSVMGLGLAVTTAVPAHAEEQPVISDQVSTIRVPGPVPLGGSGDGGNPPATVDAGDDDDTWDTIHDGGRSPKTMPWLDRLLLILESWWFALGFPLT